MPEPSQDRFVVVQLVQDEPQQVSDLLTEGGGGLGVGGVSGSSSSSGGGSSMGI